MAFASRYPKHVVVDRQKHEARLSLNPGPEKRKVDTSTARRLVMEHVERPSANAEVRIQPVALPRAQVS